MTLSSPDARATPWLTFWIESNASAGTQLVLPEVARRRQVLRPPVQAIPVAARDQVLDPVAGQDQVLDPGVARAAARAAQEALETRSSSKAQGTNFSEIIYDPQVNLGYVSSSCQPYYM